jgi:hypothetical protein
VTGYFAVLPDLRVLLNFNKCADLGVVSDFTTIKVNEFGHFNVSAEFNVVRDRQVVVHK